MRRATNNWLRRGGVLPATLGMGLAVLLLAQAGPCPGPVDVLSPEEEQQVKTIVEGEVATEVDEAIQSRRHEFDGDDCWDLNANGVADLPDEDSNGDGVVDVQDCQGQEGAGGQDAQDGTDGQDGADGKDGEKGDKGDAGEPGAECEDCDDRFVNEGQAGSVDAGMILNSAVTLPKIDASGEADGFVLKTTGTALYWDEDLTDGGGLDCEDCDDRFVNEGQVDSITTGMIEDGAVGTSKLASRAVTAGKIGSESQPSGKVLKSNDSGGVTWQNDQTGGLWSQDGADIYYDGGYVGIGTDNPGCTLDVIAQDSDPGIEVFSDHNTGEGVKIEVTGQNADYGLKAYYHSSGSGKAIWGAKTGDNGWAGYFTGRVEVNGELYVDGDNIIVENGDILPAFHHNGDRVGKPGQAWSEMWAESFNYSSSRDEKRQIEALDRDELRGMLDAVQAIDVIHFLYKNERLNNEPDLPGKELRARSVPRLGVIAETLPPGVANEDHTGVNLASYSAMLHAALKELSQRVKAQDAEINELRARLKELEGLR